MQFYICLNSFDSPATKEERFNLSQLSLLSDIGPGRWSTISYHCFRFHVELCAQILIFVSRFPYLQVSLISFEKCLV